MIRDEDLEKSIIKKTKSSRYLQLISDEEKIYLDNTFFFIETYRHKIKCLLSNTFMETFCLTCGEKNKIPYDYSKKQPKRYCSNICNFKSESGRLRNSFAQKNRKKNLEHSNLAKKRYIDLLNNLDFIYQEKNIEIENDILNKKKKTTQYHAILNKNEIFYLNSFWSYANTIKERVFLMENNIRDRPRCTECSIEINSPFISVINKRKYLKKFCSSKCKALSKEVRQKISNSVSSLYERDNNLSSNKLKSGRRWREFKMPSGKIVLVQGYESFALNDLLKIFKEEDIFVHKGVPKIIYTYDNVQRNHFADIYIKSTNTLIDVKSKFTFDIDLDKNNAKKIAAEGHGYNYQFLIISRR